MEKLREDRIFGLRHALAGLPREKWEQFFAQHCAGDPSLVEAVLALENPSADQEPNELSRPFVSDIDLTITAPAPPLILRDRYRIVRPIGGGGMGTVFEAIDLRLRNVVAVKQMIASGFDADQAFEREASLLASLRHPALPVVIDYFIDDKARFLVMQYIDGEDLSRVLARQRGPCSFRDVLSWAFALLDVLDYLHSQVLAVVHRDIKPSNVRLTPRAELVLLDFGLAKGRTILNEGATAEKSFFGYTPRYSPPEQVRGLGTTPQSDLYALGATLYHLATNTAPPSASDRVAARIAGLPDPLVSAYRVNPGLSDRFSEILTRAMALDPSERFASAGEIRRALEAHGDGAAISATKTPISDRRVDAAMPSRTEVGRQIDLIVQVRFAESPQLGLEDWPTRRRPAAIEQESEAVRVAYPLDPRSGAYLPARLRLKVVAPDFVIEGDTERLIEVPPDEYSRRVAFLLCARRLGLCRLNVEVYAPDALYLGAISVESEAISMLASSTELRVANLVLVLLSDASRTAAVVAPPPLSAAVADEQTHFGGDSGLLAPHHQRPTTSARAQAVGGALAVIALTALITWQGPLFWRSTRSESAASRPVGNGPAHVSAGPALATSSVPATRTFTITKPTGGTIVGAGGLLCGTYGSACSIEIPNGAAPNLSFIPDPKYKFVLWTGDCVTNGSKGEGARAAAKTCGAIFKPIGGAPSPSDPIATSRAADAFVEPSRRTQPMVAMSPALSNPEQMARMEIMGLVAKYCMAYETLKPEAVKALLRSAAAVPPMERLKDYKSLKCTTTTSPEFVALDPIAGNARLTFGMKQVTVLKSNDAVTTIDSMVTMAVSRADATWLVDRVQHDPLTPRGRD